MYFASFVPLTMTSGKGPHGSPLKSVVELRPTTLPDVGRSHHLHWSYSTCGTVVFDWNVSGASTNTAARPPTRAHVSTRHPHVWTCVFELRLATR